MQRHVPSFLSDRRSVSDGILTAVSKASTPIAQQMAQVSSRITKRAQLESRAILATIAPARVSHPPQQIRARLRTLGGKHQIVRVILIPEMFLRAACAQRDCQLQTAQLYSFQHHRYNLRVGSSARS